MSQSPCLPAGENDCPADNARPDADATNAEQTNPQLPSLPTAPSQDATESLHLADKSSTPLPMTEPIHLPEVLSLMRRDLGDSFHIGDATTLARGLSAIRKSKGSIDHIPTHDQSSGQSPIDDTDTCEIVLDNPKFLERLEQLAGGELQRRLEGLDQFSLGDQPGVNLSEAFLAVLKVIVDSCLDALGDDLVGSYGRHLTFSCYFDGVLPRRDVQVISDPPKLFGNSGGDPDRTPLPKPAADVEMPSLKSDIDSNRFMGYEVDILLPPNHPDMTLGIARNRLKVKPKGLFGSCMLFHPTERVMHLLLISSYGKMTVSDGLDPFNPSHHKGILLLFAALLTWNTPVDAGFPQWCHKRQMHIELDADKRKAALRHIRNVLFELSPGNLAPLPPEWTIHTATTLKLHRWLQLELLTKGECCTRTDTRKGFLSFLSLLFMVLCSMLWQNSSSESRICETQGVAGQ